MVNDAVLKDLPVSWREASLEEAREEGAVALFGERYGETVRIVKLRAYPRNCAGEPT